MYDKMKKEYEDEVHNIDLWLIIELCTLENLNAFANKNELSIKKKIDLMLRTGLTVQHLH